ncbi:DUF6505 family protein [Sphingomonas daechungensis]|uniref:DUF6505 family protein n=1 Tax=Sphingomonas daechungensis TaxID=1176646 RepID=UPI0037848C00
MKMPRCVRFDESDARVFPKAANPGEWAIPGGFVFADADPAALTQSQRQAFANGFLGLTSFGWSTLASVATISDVEFAVLATSLAEHLRDVYGAPDIAVAEAAAREELAYAASLCEHPVNTLLSLNRKIEGEHMVEQFRVVPSPGDRQHARIWELHSDEQ